MDIGQNFGQLIGQGINLDAIPVELTPPYTDDLAAWYDMTDAATLFQEISSPSTTAVAGDVVGTILDKSGNDYHMAAPANGNRGSLVAVNGTNRLRLRQANTNYYTNAALPLNKRAHSIFTVVRNFGSPNAQSVMHWPPSGGSTFALYNNNSGGPTDDPIYAYASGGVNSGLKYGYRGSLEPVFTIGGAANAYMGNGPELYTRGSAYSAGTAIGGNIGYWNGAFPANKEYVEVLVYDREMTPSEANEVLDYLAAHTGCVSRTENRFLLAAGDSITEGNALPDVGDTDSYLAQLMNLYSSPPKSVNSGAGGQSLTTNTGMSTQIAALNGAASYVHRLAIVMYGTNDIGAGRTSAQLIADINTAATNLNGVSGSKKIMWLSILPRSAFNSTQNGYIDDANAHLASLEGLDAGNKIDYYLDVAADARLADPDDTEYYSDGVHPTVAGEAVIAELIKARLDAEGWGT